MDVRGIVWLDREGAGTGISARTRKGIRGRDRPSPSSIVRALERLEAGGVLTGFNVGRARIYEYNPRYPLRDELSVLVAQALAFYPAELRNALEVYRRRPRRKGKPL